MNDIVDTLENDESEYINAYDQHSETDELRNETKVIEYTEYTDQNFENRDREEQEEEDHHNQAVVIEYYDDEDPD